MIDLNIGEEGKAFVAEPLPEERPVEIPETPEREKVLVPVARVEDDREILRVS